MNSTKGDNRKRLSSIDNNIIPCSTNVENNVPPVVAITTAPMQKQLTNRIFQSFASLCTVIHFLCIHSCNDKA
jgi:hypothetical protein